MSTSFSVLRNILILEMDMQWKQEARVSTIGSKKFEVTWWSQVNYKESWFGCLRIYIYIYIYGHIWIQIKYICIYTCTKICMIYIRVQYIYIYIYIHEYICIYIYIYWYEQACIYIYIYRYKKKKIRHAVEFDQELRGCSHDKCAGSMTPCRQCWGKVNMKYRKMKLEQHICKIVNDQIVCGLKGKK
jgi:hypothetical protein